MKTQERARYADPLPLAQDLIRCRSVTPHDDGCMAVLEGALGELGFTCTRVPSATAGPRIENLYARLGKSAPNFCFAGHTDVVPPGDTTSWRFSTLSTHGVRWNLFWVAAPRMQKAG